MSTIPQIRKIHVLRNELSIAEDAYRALLHSFKQDDENPVVSSKDLSVSQASSLIESLESMIEKQPLLRNRIYASDKQERLIFALWRKVTHARDPDGTRRTLENFLNKHFHIRRSHHLLHNQAPKVIKALRIMNERINKH